MINNLDHIEHEGIKYPVTYKSGKPFCYAYATIKGQLLKGYGADAGSAYEDLDSEIYQAFIYPKLIKEHNEK